MSTGSALPPRPLAAHLTISISLGLFPRYPAPILRLLASMLVCHNLSFHITLVENSPCRHYSSLCGPGPYIQTIVREIPHYHPALCGPDITHLATVGHFTIITPPYADLYLSHRRPNGYSSHTITPHTDQTSPIWRPYGHFYHHYSSLCGSVPLPQTTVRVLSPHHHALIGSGPSPQSTVQVLYRHYSTLCGCVPLPQTTVQVFYPHHHALTGSGTPTRRPSTSRCNEEIDAHYPIHVDRLRSMSMDAESHLLPLIMLALPGLCSFCPSGGCTQVERSFYIAERCKEGRISDGSHMLRRLGLDL